MTGGIGFSRFSQLSQANNRALKPLRSPMRNNPYVQSSVHRHFVKKEFEERIAYSKAQSNKLRKQRWIMFLIGLVLISALHMAFYLF
jgi:hypothetical protein